MPKLRTLGAIAAMIAAAGFATGASAQAQYPFQDPNLPISKRVDDLVSRMTLAEKAAQMGTDAPAIPRLGIPEYNWWSESLHGDAVSPATVFPEPIGLAATFDLGLEGRIADAISDEDRAWYNKTGGAGHPESYHGLTFFAPNINIFRDPRWGRGQETYGEDPYLTARFGVTYIKGLQGSDPKYFKIVATAKHYAVHSGPETERHRFDANVSAYDLHDTYLPAFKAAVTEAHAQSVMGAYSSLYGVPDNASPLLLQQTLRDAWGFDGYVVSDCGAIGDIFANHHYAGSPAEAAADAVKAGCDLDCGGEYSNLPDAVKQGFIDESLIDVSVKRLFTERMKLGMFDPPAQVPYASIPPSVIDSDEHRKIALQAARESIVLLKNKNDFLPLKADIKSIAVIGPNANDAAVLRGNYNGTSHHEVTVLEGLQKRAGDRVRIDYVPGSGLLDASDMTLVPSAALTSGGQPGLKGEYFDNETLDGAPKAVRQDGQIAFSWNDSPLPGIPALHFSARWTGELTPTQTGVYTLGVRGDDGFRLFIDGKKVIDDWNVHAPESKTATVTLTAGQPVSIKLEYFQGEGGAEVSLSWQAPSGKPFADAIAAAKADDAVVFVGGISSQIEGEEGTGGNGDRVDMNLPNIQEDLLKALAATGKPVVVVLMNGSALSVNWAQEHVPAIVDAWYPGEEGGTAVAEALFGDFSPAGRLPVTFYTGVGQLPPFRDYAMKNRTYRYFEGAPLYPFGYGLSYTRFAYSGLQVSAITAPQQPVTVSAQVENTGGRAGDEVVELYLRPAPRAKVREIEPGQPMPRLQLAGFQRVALVPHERKTVTFTLDPDQLRLVDAKGERTLQPGEWQVFVGGHQPELGGLDFGVLSGIVTVK